MDARLFLLVAEKLANTKSSDPEAPAAYRSSISRSYYAAFSVAVAFLEQIGVEVVDKPQGHSWVKNSFIYTPEAAFKAIGMSLETLHKERKYADYELKNPKPEKRQAADAAFKQSSKVIADLDAYRLSPGKRALVEAAIKRWVTATPGCGLRVV
jgi:hypothetical protein